MKRFIERIRRPLCLLKQDLATGSAVARFKLGRTSEDVDVDVSSDRAAYIQLVHAVLESFASSAGAREVCESVK